MNSKDLLKIVLEMRNDIYNLQEQTDIILASLRLDEVISSLKKRKTISVSTIQREYKMGYSASRVLINTLLEKGLIERIGKSLVYHILNK